MADISWSRINRPQTHLDLLSQKRKDHRKISKQKAKAFVWKKDGETLHLIKHR